MASGLTLREEIIKQVFRVQEVTSSGELDPHKVRGMRLTCERNCKLTWTRKRTPD